MSLLAVYERLLTTNPLLTKGGTSFVLSVISSVLGQIVQNKELNVARSMKFALVLSPPFSHYWYPLLDKLSNWVRYHTPFTANSNECTCRL